MNGLYDYLPADAHSPGAGFGPSPWQSAAGEPFLYTVAAKLHRLIPLSRAENLAIWRRVLELYAVQDLAIPKPLQDLCDERVVDSLLENEVFWGMVGAGVSREFYSRASDYLPAVYATAALLAAMRDRLPLSRRDQLLAQDPDASSPPGLTG
jgi:hypothetical protein